MKLVETETDSPVLLQGNSQYDTGTILGKLWSISVRLLETVKLYQYGACGYIITSILPLLKPTIKTCNLCKNIGNFQHNIKC